MNFDKWMIPNDRASITFGVNMDFIFSPNIVFNFVCKSKRFSFNIKYISICLFYLAHRFSKLARSSALRCSMHKLDNTSLARVLLFGACALVIIYFGGNKSVHGKYHVVRRRICNLSMPRFSFTEVKHSRIIQFEFFFYVDLFMQINSKSD